MKQSAQSTRSVQRYSCYSDLSVTYEGRSTSWPARQPDLSPNGMFIPTARAFPEGAVVKLQFRLTHLDYLVETRAEVRYCQAGVGIGVEFIEISSEAREAIKKELAYLTGN